MSVIDLSPFNAILTRLEGVAERLERGAASAPSQGATANGSGAAPAAAAPAADDCAIAVAFDAFIQEKLPPLTAAAKDVGNQDVIEATDFFADGMGLLRELLAATGVCAKPQDTAWQKILGAVMELGTKAQKACDNRSECFQNRKSAAEALNVITLVTSLSPPAHVQNVLESMDFYATKVMQKKNEKETVWIKALKTAVKDLKDWCGENCKLGVMWNPRGKVAADYFAENPLGSGGKASAASEPKGKGKGKGPAMPKGGLAAPPPELLAKMKPEAGSAAPAAAGMSAVFAGIVKYYSTADAMKAIFLGSYLNVLLPLTPLGIAAPRLGWSDEAVFCLNFFAILPLAQMLGQATEHLSSSVGETLGGLLNASFGNAVEMLLSIFALQEGLVGVVQGSLLGSILSNLLLVLGMCFFFGGIKFHNQKYNADGARVQSNLLLLSVLAMVIPSLVALGDERSSQLDTLYLSRGAACLLGVMYALYLIFQLKTHPDYFTSESAEEDDEEHMTPLLATVLLVAVTLIVALASEGLVGSVQGISKNQGISEHFIGVILLPIVGNAAEHLTA
ncbi:unnamed protein product, partial [Polarella glacialis]